MIDRSQTSDGMIRRAKAYIEGCLDQERPPRVEEFATREGESRFSVSRRFREMTGSSLGLYMRLHQIERAKRLLERTDLPIKEVSHKVGFSNQESFARAFRRAVKSSPSRYRDVNHQCH